MVFVWLQLTLILELFWGRRTVGKIAPSTDKMFEYEENNHILRSCFPEIKDQIFQVDEMECVLDSAHRAFREREHPKERLEIRSVERREKRESLKVRFIFILNFALSHMISHFSMRKRSCSCPNQLCLSWWFTLLPSSSSLICPSPLDYLTYPLTYSCQVSYFSSGIGSKEDREREIFDCPERDAIGNQKLLFRGQPLQHLKSNGRIAKFVHGSSTDQNTSTFFTRFVWLARGIVKFTPQISLSL